MKAIVYHAHVYFEPREQSRALSLRTRVQNELGLKVGTVHNQPVGPHTQGMFQILIPVEALGSILLWLMQHRDGLNILLHADTGNDYIDHTEHLTWLGAPLKLNLDVFDRP